MVQFVNGIPPDVTRDVPDSARKDLEHREVRFSLAELEAVQEEVMEILADRGLNFPSSISLSKDIVEIYASSHDAGNALLASIDASLAEKIAIADPIVLDPLEPEIGEISGSEDIDLKDQGSVNELPTAVDIEDWEYVRGGAKLYEFSNG